MNISVYADYNEYINNYKGEGAMINVDKCWEDAKNEIENSYLELGKKYFEANKDNEKDPFAEQLDVIKTMYEKEKLWHQYKLKQEGKLLCESCGAIITDDSLFCNKCGAKIPEFDFSIILPEGEPEEEPAAEENVAVVAPTPEVAPAPVVIQPVAAPVANICPTCGRELPSYAMFCEDCGTKVK